MKKLLKRIPLFSPFLFGILLVVGTNKIAAEGIQEKTSSLVISVKRETRFMNGPVYNIEIYENGDVVYSGIGGVKTRGRVELKISQEAVKKLLEDIEASGFFCIIKPEERRWSVLILEITFNGKYKKLKCKGLYMKGLNHLRLMVEETAKIRQLRCPNIVFKGTEGYCY
jgi:hypothetical protein